MGDDCCDIRSGVEVLAELLVLFGLFLDHVECVLGAFDAEVGGGAEPAAVDEDIVPVMYAESSLARNKAV